MTQFQSDLIVTCLDILAFFSVTTDLYGRRLDAADAIMHDEKYQQLVEAAIRLLIQQDWIARMYLFVFRKYPLKHLLLIQGVLLFLAARGVSLAHSYFSG